MLGGPRIAVFGVPAIVRDLVLILEEQGAFVPLCETERDFAMLPPAETLVDQYLDYAYPYGIGARLCKFQRLVEEREVDGIVIYQQAFCHHNLELSRIERAFSAIPTLTVEGDLPGRVTPRDLIRLEAFVERLTMQGPSGAVAGRSMAGPRGGDLREDQSAVPHDGWLLGLDLGSRFAKVVAQAPDGREETLTLDAVAFYRDFATRTEGSLELDLRALASRLNLDGPQDGFRAVSTGYGRNLVRFENATAVPELSAHAAGASAQVEEERFLLIDLGGQDTKALVVDNGRVDSFVMNDKCAAGSGRYVENMARLLGVELDEVLKHVKNPVALTNVCATFGESEVVGKVVEGVALERICAGIMGSVAARTAQMVQRLEAQGLPVYLAGGLADSPALAHFLARYLRSATPRTLRRHRMNGALGCVALLRRN